MIDKTLEALERLMPLFEKSMRELAFTAEKAGEVTADMNTLRAALAAPSAGPVDEVELLKGWKLNHIQFVRGSGTAEIGYLDAEDDRFSPVVTVDTGLYYQPQDAVPLARAILDRLATPAQPPAAQPAVPTEQVLRKALAVAIVLWRGGQIPDGDEEEKAERWKRWAVAFCEQHCTEGDRIDAAIDAAIAAPSAEAEPAQVAQGEGEG